MRLNGHGQIAHDEWYHSVEIRAELALDAFVVMPNHVHGIVFINGQEGDPPVVPALALGPRPRSLGHSLPDTNCPRPGALPGHKPVQGRLEGRPLSANRIRCGNAITRAILIVRT